MTDLALVPYAMVDPLAQLEQAAELLAEARTAFDIPSKVKPVIDIAEAMRVLARQAGLGLIAQNHAAAIKLRAERKAGELLAETPKQKPGEYQRLHDATVAPRLEDIGITKAQSHRWQAVASLPLPTFEAYIADAKERGEEITTAGTLRLAAEQQRSNRAPARTEPSALARPSRVRILVGDVRAGLATLPDESVQTVPTSVPYWGLRAYGTEPQVWGGDAAHQHDWTTVPYVWSPGGRGEQSIESSGLSSRSSAVRQATKRPRPTTMGDTCECGGWLGELGSEPTPELYVEHVVEVFRALWRVLRKDGTVWLNIGFSYAGSGKGPTGWNGASDQEHRQGFTGEGPKRLAGRGEGAVPTGRTHTRNLGFNERWGRSPGQFKQELGQPARPPVHGYKPKDLIPIPWLVAMALQADGWYWRSTIAWCKKAPMPESVDDRPTSAWEPILLLSKSRTYFYDADAVREKVGEPTRRNNEFRGVSVYRDHIAEGLTPVRPAGVSGQAEPSLDGRNMRNVWELGPEPFPGAHFAVFPTEVPRRCILAGSRPGDLVLDPFAGAATTLMVAAQLGRDSVGIELKPEYAEMGRARVIADGGFTVDVECEVLPCPG